MDHAATIIIETPDGIALNQKDSTYALPNTVTLFGGGVEHGETAEVAARRELAEETSLGWQASELRHYKQFNFPGRKFDVYILKSDTSIFEVYEGAGSFLFKSADDLDKLENHTRQIMEAYLEDAK